MIILMVLVIALNYLDINEEYLIEIRSNAKNFFEVSH